MNAVPELGDCGEADRASSPCGPVLALPGEFTVGYEMVDVSMLRVHVFLREGDQKEDFWILDDESRIPDGLAEGEAESRRNSVTRIAPPSCNP